VRPSLLERTSQTTQDDGTTAEEAVPRTIVSLSVDQAEAQKLIYATKAGELYFAILGKDASVNVGAPATDGGSLRR